MGTLRSLAVALALLAATPAHADQVGRWRTYIEEASARFGVPAAWIERVMRAESGGQTRLNGRPITSHAGAMGLMQLMPGTWAEMRAVLRLGADPHDPRDNILAGTYYLRLMYERFGYSGMFAAYNAGPARYANHLATGRRLPGETRSYLVTVGGGLAGSRAVAIAPPYNALFFALRTTPTAPAAGPKAPDVFVTLRSDHLPE
ncbi:lytic transglycosylase domain-containing protein [Sphingomonas gilva]|uniref:Lytic transglycosylase domain-containing protein n=1 Tax=Sphingomonas gilva TaxID=2305907 RepID=A0A396RMH3_9SPHN|nr:lytic transglycosylase domain-containing protein [Sphingomonas gilva]RHW16856.1 lytic transglycosylase domain-containing protein [Sphingomonas gilva]